MTNDCPAIPSPVTTFTAKKISVMRVQASIIQDLAGDKPASEEVFRRHLGPRGSREFWEYQLSSAISVSSFVRILAHTAAPNYDEIRRIENLLYYAMIDAHKLGQDFFCGQTARLETAKHPTDISGDDSIIVQGRRAAAWLLEHPKWRDFVPSTLAAYLTGTEDGADQSRALQHATYKTGVSGRPSSKHIFMRKLADRARLGQLEPTCRAEAQTLHTWLKQEHPDAAKTTAKTVEEAIRTEFRRYRSAPKTIPKT